MYIDIPVKRNEKRKILKTFLDFFSGEFRLVRRTLRDKLIEVLVPSVGILIVKIFSHGQNNVVGHEML